MKKNILLLICFISIISACKKRDEVENKTKDNLAKEISFITSDSIKIFGDLFVVDKTSPVILLFHQGGSNARAEYKPIIPKLVEKGFNILAIGPKNGRASIW